MILRVKLFFSLLLLCVPILSFADYDADIALNKAIVFYQKADKLQGAWISTHKLIKKAQEAITQNNQKLAYSLAVRAKHEAELSFIQAQDQLENWSEPSYIK